jgi:hypothetical protein
MCCAASFAAAEGNMADDPLAAVTWDKAEPSRPAPKRPPVDVGVVLLSYGKLLEQFHNGGIHGNGEDLVARILIRQ